MVSLQKYLPDITKLKILFFTNAEPKVKIRWQDTTMEWALWCKRVYGASENAMHVMVGPCYNMNL